MIGRVFSPSREPVARVHWAMGIVVCDGLEKQLTGVDTGTDVLFAHCALPVRADIVFSFRKPGMMSGSIGRQIKDPLTVIAVRMDPEKKRK
jgi:hypothetical protein